MDVEIRKQRRKSLAFKLTPSGAVALIPAYLDGESPVVQRFIEDAREFTSGRTSRSPSGPGRCSCPGSGLG